MIKNIILVSTASVLVIVSLTSCSSTQTSEYTDEIPYQSTSNFKHEMTYRFDRFDSSRDGKVNFSEWQAGLQIILQEFDEDGNGSFEYEKGERSNFKWMSIANKNEDKVISPSEINAGLKTMFNKASRADSLISKREFNTFNWITGETFAKRKRSLPKK
jgi:hypothetical protein